MSTDAEAVVGSFKSRDIANLAKGLRRYTAFLQASREDLHRQVSVGLSSDRAQHPYVQIVSIRRGVDVVRGTIWELAIIYREVSGDDFDYSAMVRAEQTTSHKRWSFEPAEK